MGAAGRFARSLAVFLSSLCLASSFALPIGAAQTIEPTVDLRLVSQPIWHEPGDPLGIDLEVANEGPEVVGGFLIRVAAHQRADTRSGLSGAFGDASGFEASAFTDDSSADRELAPGTSVSVSLDGSISTLSSLTSAPSGGVYPLTISLFDAAGGERLDSLTTALIFYDGPVDLPLQVVPVVPINAVPSRGPDGIFRAPAGSPSLEDAVGGEGWLSSLVEVLEEETQPPAPPERGRSSRKRRNRRQPPPEPVERLHLGLAPTPRLIEELADMADGYRRGMDDGFESVAADDPAAANARALLDRLAALLRMKGVQPLLTPYSFPDLPALARQLPLEDTSAELSEAQTILAEQLDLDLDGRWILPPASRLDLGTLDGIKGLGVPKAQRTFFSSDILEPSGEPGASGCPQPFASYTCPVKVTTAHGPTKGYVTDPGLQDRLAAIGQPGDDALDLQRFFAETAVIREELPGVEGRVVQANVPSLWHPSAGLARTFYSGLVDAPWLQTITPNQGLHAPRQSPQTRRLKSAIDSLAGEPDSTFFASLEDAQDLVKEFSEINPPASMVQRLTRNTLVAQSRLWWRNVITEGYGTAYARDTIDEVNRQLSNITLKGLDEISLTSERGEIPVVVSNESDYDVAVAVRLVAPELELEEDRFQFTVEPHSVHQLTARATVRSSGIFFPMAVKLETPDGTFEIASKSVTIRSTDLNVIALAITLGALAFLVLFYVARVIRGRRKAPTEGAPA